MSETKTRAAGRPILVFAVLSLGAACVGMLLSGCNRQTASPPEESAQTGDESKIKICYLGLTCEPAIFVAHDKGFFKEEGLDVELVKTDWSDMREGLDAGRYHASYSLIMYMMKPIELGKDLKLTSGIHTGCLRVQAGAKSDVQTIKNLKNRRVGVTHMGSPPFLFASRVLADNGMDPKKDVEWVTMAEDTIAKALDEGRVEAVASAEPMGTMLMAANKVR